MRKYEFTIEDLFEMTSSIDPKVLGVRTDYLNNTEGLDAATALGILLGFIPMVEPKKVRKTCNCDNKCNKPVEKTVSRKSKADLRLVDFVDRIISQDKATIIFWKDGTKTVVRCNDVEPYDYEKGIAMAVLKYVFGNNYYKEDMQQLMSMYPHVTTESVKKIENKNTTEKLLETKTTSKKTDSNKKKTTEKKSSSNKKSTKAKADAKDK